jgi:predicted unusual protein kinase regulating ubiquinone biosynthesis (AarF/ABC1/UbiB family)
METNESRRPDERSESRHEAEHLRDLMRDYLARAGAVARRIDRLSLDLARDAGSVLRDAQALAGAATARWQRVRSNARATPRAARVIRAGAGLIARFRWHRLVAAARGDATIGPDAHRDLARRAAALAGDLRGGVAKIGQVASCRPDLFGPIWSSELAALQDRIAPVAWDDGIATRLANELAAAVDDVFASFDRDPIAAASLAQVHFATLADGTPVAVKVQVPGIEDVIDSDIAALRALAAIAGDAIPGADLTTTADELARVLVEELDYRAEADALTAYRAATDRVDVPAPIAAASTERVLTMTRVAGVRIVEHLDGAPPAERERVLRILVDETADAIFGRGLAHADPHPGNFVVDPTTGRIAMLDFGCVMRLSSAERTGYARVLLAVVAGDRATAATELAALGFAADDPAALVALTERLLVALRPGTTASAHDWEAAVRAEIAAARAAGPIAVPRSFVLLGRVLATLAGLFARYRPALELHAVIAPHVIRAAAG